MTISEQIRQIDANIQAAKRVNATLAAKIDSTNQRIDAKRSTTGAHSGLEKKAKLAPDSIYDLCEGTKNPALAAVLRKMQARAYK